MTDNPYQPHSGLPPTLSDFGPLPDKMPWPLLAVGVLFVIFGGLQLLALPQTIVGFMIQGYVPNMGTSPEEREMFTKIQSVTSSLMIPALAIAIVDFAFGLGFIYSGVQLFRKKLIGAIWGKRLILASIPMFLIRMGVGIYGLYLQQDIFAAMGANSPLSGDTLRTMTIVFAGIGLGIQALFSLAYYIVVFLILKNPSNLAYLKLHSQ